jgi:aminopeptidase
VTPEERLERYAELVVRVGANVQRGQDVVVLCHVEHVEVTRAIARAAFRAGAARVFPIYSDRHVQRAAIELGPEETLGRPAPWALEMVEHWKTSKPALVNLAGLAEPDLFADLDPERVARSEPRELRAAYLPIVSERITNWVIASAPGPGWATTVFGEPDVERLWQAVATATRLDAPDPVAAWRDHIERLATRATALTERAFDALRYRGPGTDLTVGLIPGHVWMCARFATTVDGLQHVPNLPTEEVFTTPDWRRAEGTVRSTMPLVLPTLGARVDGLELTLRDGRIVDVRADGGTATLVESQLEDDERARYLGELALVTGDSAVRKTGLVFHETLFDENATCHIAYGNGLPFTQPDADGLDAEGLLTAGVNVARAHVDFMVGGPEVEIDGLDVDGRATPLIRDEAWVLD